MGKSSEVKCINVAKEGMVNCYFLFNCLVKFLFYFLMDYSCVCLQRSRDPSGAGVHFWFLL